MEHGQVQKNHTNPNDSQDNGYQIQRGKTVDAGAARIIGIVQYIDLVSLPLNDTFPVHFFRKLNGFPISGP